jgi:hypothetical protein
MFVAGAKVRYLGLKAKEVSYEGIWEKFDQLNLSPDLILLLSLVCSLLPIHYLHLLLTKLRSMNQSMLFSFHFILQYID